MADETPRMTADDMRALLAHADEFMRAYPKTDTPYQFARACVQVTQTALAQIDEMANYQMQISRLEILVKLDALTKARHEIKRLRTALADHPVLATARAWRVAGRALQSLATPTTPGRTELFQAYEVAENAFIAALDEYVNATEDRSAS